MIQSRPSLPCVLAVIVAVTLSSCSGSASNRGVERAEPTRLSATERSRLVERLGDVVDCVDRIEFSDELSFYDTTAGLDCQLASGDAVFIRVLRTSTAVLQSVDEWRATLGDDRSVVLADHWYAVGPPQVIERFAALPRSSRPSMNPPAAHPLTQKQETLTTCGRFLSSAVRAYLFAPDDFTEIRDQLDVLIPGAASEIETEIPERLRKTLADEEQDDVMTSISDVVPKLKGRCASARFGNLAETAAGR